MKLFLALVLLALPFIWAISFKEERDVFPYKTVGGTSQVQYPGTHAKLWPRRGINANVNCNRTTAVTLNLFRKGLWQFRAWAGCGDHSEPCDKKRSMPMMCPNGVLKSKVFRVAISDDVNTGILGNAVSGGKIGDDGTCEEALIIADVEVNRLVFNHTSHSATVYLWYDNPLADCGEDTGILYVTYHCLPHDDRVDEDEDCDDDGDDS